MDDAALNRLKLQAHVTVNDMRLAQASIISDLRSAGIDATSIWEMRTASKTPEYRRGLPILIRYLDEDIPDNVKAQVARLLAVPQASEFWEDLLGRFERAPEGEVREALALAVSRGFRKSRLELIFELIDDEDAGRHRILFIGPLKRIRDQRVLPFLEERRNHPVIGNEIRRLLAGRAVNS